MQLELFIIYTGVTKLWSGIDSKKRTKTAVNLDPSCHIWMSLEAVLFCRSKSSGQKWVHCKLYQRFLVSSTWLTPCCFSSSTFLYLIFTSLCHKSHWFSCVKIVGPAGWLTSQKEFTKESMIREVTSPCGSHILYSAGDNSFILESC